MAAPAGVSSQLVLRSGPKQLVVGSSLSARDLADIAESTLAHSASHTSLERLWGAICSALVRHAPDGANLALSIPTHAELPTVWVSEVEPRQFVVTTNDARDAAWVTLTHRASGEAGLVASP